MQLMTTKTLLLTAAAVLLTLSPLPAQIRAMEFSVPYQFHAGNAILPAGQYLISVDAGMRHSLITVAASDSGNAIVLLPQPAAISDGPPLEATVALVFHKYGDAYFLRPLRHNGIRQTLNLQETKAEKAAARQGNLRQVALIHPR